MEALLLGDCLEQLKTLPDNSIDSVVTDPPYGLKFMGKKWDYDVPSKEVWVEVLRVLKPGGHLLSFGGTRTYHRMVVAIEDAGFEIRDQIQWIYGSGFPKSHNLKDEWQGYGTALKPANEPIVLARKPLIGTVVANVLKHGTGALNIDASRIGTEIISTHVGRWPANVLFDEQAASVLGEPSRFFYVAKASKRERNAGLEGMPKKSQGAYGEFAGDGRGRQTEHQPTANHHPTVKPLKLMQYLVRLITPKGGIVLDPFMGSGTTGCAAVSLGFDFIGCELSEEYMVIAEKRIAASQNNQSDDDESLVS